MIDRITAIIIICLFACTGCEPVPHSFSREELEIIDSLYKVARDSVDIELDKECDSVHKASYHAVVDSLREIRKKEILDIIEE